MFFYIFEIDLRDLKLQTIATLMEQFSSHIGGGFHLHGNRFPKITYHCHAGGTVFQPR